MQIGTPGYVNLLKQKKQKTRETGSREDIGKYRQGECKRYKNKAGEARQESVNSKRK